MSDTRPRCEHLVVYPMENCATCIMRELELVRAHRDQAITVLKEVYDKVCRHEIGVQISLYGSVYTLWDRVERAISGPMFAEREK